MRTKTGPNGSADRHVKEIKRKTRRKFSAEEKIRIVLDGLRGESSISELCRPIARQSKHRFDERGEGIAESLYYNWSKDFMEAGKKRLAGDTARQATSSEVTDLKREAHDLKEVVAEQTLELRLLKKVCSRLSVMQASPAGNRWGRSRMRYPASEKLEIIRLVEGSHLPVKRTLEKLGVSRPTFYRWYDRYLQRSEAGLEDRKPHPGRVWNRIPDDVRQAMLEMALARPELSPRELAVTFTDERSYFVSESSVYRLLRSHDLITSPNFIVMKAADEFRDKTTAPNQLPLSSPQAATAGQRANRLHLSQGYRLGLVLSVDRFG